MKLQCVCVCVCLFAQASELCVNLAQCGWSPGWSWCSLEVLHPAPVWSQYQGLWVGLKLYASVCHTFDYINRSYQSTCLFTNSSYIYLFLMVKTWSLTTSCNWFADNCILGFFSFCPNFHWNQTSFVNIWTQCNIWCILHLFWIAVDLLYATCTLSVEFISTMSKSGRIVEGLLVFVLLWFVAVCRCAGMKPA